MLFGTYTFNCTFESQAFLPQFKGSTLRGALGHSLKRIACALRRQDCSTCLLSDSCAYASLFEIKKNILSETNTPRTAHRPHPYVINPPSESKRVYEPGDPFSFQIILFGKTNEYLPHLLYAVQEMGRSGLGSQKKTDGVFMVENVQQAGSTIFSGEKLEAKRPLEKLCLDIFPKVENDKIALSFKTPLRLKYHNQLQDSLPFHIIIRTALRRYSSLESAYGEKEIELDYRGIFNLAEKVETIASSCQWHDIERYSNRQKRSMLFGGVLGNITYQGEGLAQFIPLLKYCEVTHLGKQTSFGLGQIEVKGQ